MAPPAKRFGGTPAEVAIEQWLTGTIASSLERRAQPRAELVLIGATEFGLSERRANAVRERVINRLDACAWRKGGAPRGKRQRR